ncbi:MAG: hemerythrin domain-containing protein [Syntrophorhabdaceae bacterium]
MQKQFTFFSLAVLIGLAFVATSVTHAITDSVSKSTMYAQARPGSSTSDVDMKPGSDLQEQRGSDMNQQRGSDMDRQQRSGDMQQRTSDMQGGDLFATLRQEHQQVKQMLSQLQNVTDPTQRNEMVKQLNVALYPHLKAEEKTLYKALKDDKNSKEMVKQAQKEHDQAEKALKDVNKSINDTTFAANVSKLEQLVTAHVQREESQVFAAARNLDQSKLSEVANNYRTEHQKLAQKSEEKSYGKDRSTTREGSERSTSGDRTGTSSGAAPGSAPGTTPGR